MNAIAEKIKSLRESKKITLEAMAAALGINLTTYAAREKRGKFVEAEFGKVLKRLGVTREQFDAYKAPGRDGMSLSLPETLISIESKIDVALSAIAELLAKQNGQSVTGVSNDLLKVVKERYERKINELLK